MYIINGQAIFIQQIILCIQPIIYAFNGELIISYMFNDS